MNAILSFYHRVWDTCGITVSKKKKKIYIKYINILKMLNILDYS